MQTLVKMEGITKEFPGVKALDNISLEINAGEVHVLLGENGAGKSTLMKILSGVYTPTSGKITVKGKEYSRLTPQDSYDLGISIIYQELSVINELSILENLFVGKLPTKKDRELFLLWIMRRCVRSPRTYLARLAFTEIRIFLWKRSVFLRNSRWKLRRRWLQKPESLLWMSRQLL